MHNPLPHTIYGHTFWIFPERCMLWEKENTLIVADLHLGKSGHFRKSGVAIPQNLFKADLQRLMAMIHLCKADRLIIVGDFTHSSLNKELDLFLKWRKDFSLLQIDLIKGNHDILEDDWYKEAKIKRHEWELIVNGFLFCHEDKRKKRTVNPEILFTFQGHVHPGVVLKGSGKQKLKFPCFYFTQKYAILPAFSRFSGMCLITPQKGEIVYAITPAKIIKLC